MKLDALLAAIVDAPARAHLVDVTGLTADSREVEPGALFAALPGVQADGARFVPAAVAAGAVAVLAGVAADVGDPGVPVVRTDDPRRALALIAARFFAKQPATIVAVTGTNGKTSVAEFTRQLFAALGHEAASIGTIGVVRPDGSIYGSLTTPDPVTLHRELAVLADAGVTHLAFEASSHGLVQRRLDGVAIKAAAFTNLGRDHLDYHSGVEDYFAAKLRLFDTLLAGAGGDGDAGTAVVDLDQERSAAVVAVANRRGQRVIGIGGSASADMRLVSTRPDGFRQVLSIAFSGEVHEVELPLIGHYQATNAMLAAGLVIATGAPPGRVFEAMARLHGVRGRLEVAANVRDALVVVDYAHKPEALDAALDALRPFASARLISLFGCGGDRDRGKRPIMGAISASKADLTIITDDNPRGEPPAAVRAEILKSCPGAIEIGDRYQAIRHAMMQLRPGDVLLVAGKGHETGQIVGDQTLPFSDHEVIAKIAGEI